MKKGILREVTEASVEYLQSRADLSGDGLTILARHKGDIEQTVNEQLAKLGLYIFVHPLKPLKVWQNGPGLYFEELEWSAEVGEMPDVNSTGLSAEYAAELVVLHMMTWDAAAFGVQGFYPANDVIAPAPILELNAYFITLKCNGGIPPIP